jgi:hypothetical protein
MGIDAEVTECAHQSSAFHVLDVSGVLGHIPLSEAKVDEVDNMRFSSISPRMNQWTRFSKCIKILT